MAKTNIQISESVINKCVETIFNKISEDTANVFGNNISNLLTEAKNLLSISGSDSFYSKFNNLVNHRNMIKKKIEKIEKSGEVEISTNELNNLIKEKNNMLSEIRKFHYENIPEWEKFMTQLLKFQRELNIFMGKPQTLAIVMTRNVGTNPTPEVYELNLLDEDNIKNFLSAKVYSNEFGANINATFSKLEEHAKKIENGVNTSLNETYSEVFLRYNKAKKHNSNMILYRKGKEWEGYKIQSRGSINEAYANFFYNGNFTTWKNIESRVRYYIEHGILIIDNESGLFNGDILDRTGRSIQVKSKGASILQEKQAINLAMQIVQKFNKGSDPKEILKFLVKEELLAKESAHAINDKTKFMIKDSVTSSIEDVIKNINMAVPIK